MDAQDEYGFTPLFEAVTAGNIDVLEYLIDQGAQYDHIDREKRSAIHWAVIYGKVSVSVKIKDTKKPLTAKLNLFSWIPCCVY